eukprot:CAMPEP_0201523970 /NCGR_PEP_ID=MMETSP0161_2-20130828/21032_1 /ASSEMBLY_ACC=CAM_ASM_000251 /TAXON_ID=180227 /ORGANISM="Neoparamoeba aestuarina, Strain SoJaBio B1-5/56/2" /LENGTH=263 /DNA_ID=CAMNT_0047923213 /DNA_START=133 /DNA_END=921 /DNA_ORIENTATION=+
MASGKKGNVDEDLTGIPPLVEDCIAQIRERGLQEDGILRVSGSAAQIKDLQNLYRKGKRQDLSNVYIHTVGGVLKNYFRDMEKPILTFEAYDDFLQTNRIKEESEKVAKVRSLVAALPIENQELLHKIIIFILEVSKFSEENQMPLQNLAMMFGPTFLRKKDQDRAELLKDLNDVIAVTNVMLLHPMFENWPDDQDLHPARTFSNFPEDEERAKKVRKALDDWYGEIWEKELLRMKRLGLVRATSLLPMSEYSKLDGGAKKEG